VQTGTSITLRGKDGTILASTNADRESGPSFIVTNFVSKSSTTVLSVHEMSFQRPAAGGASSSTLTNDIRKLKTEVDALRSLDVSTAEAQRSANRTQNDLKKRVTIIESKLPTDPNVAQLGPELAQVKSALTSAEGEIQVRIEEATKPAHQAALPPDATQEQIQLAREQGQHLEYLEEQAGEIVEQMQVLNEITHQVGEVIERDHEKIVHVDAVVTEAKDEMVAGNEELAVAEDHQKKTCLLC
jgi:hypothetical protein